MTLGRGQRSRRDWIVDIVLVVLCLALAEPLRRNGYSDLESPPTGAWAVVDLVLGIAGSLALWFRRRRPAGLAIAMGVLTFFSQALGPAAAVALFTVVVHRPPRVSFSVAALHLAVYAVWLAVFPSTDLSLLIRLFIGVLLFVALIAWGLVVRSRRELVASLRERAERAEAEQAMLAERARVGERTRIAREMHDVLAHRVSLIALHAGALELADGRDPESTQRTAALIRTTARLALEDLRGVIGVLRAGGSPEDVPEAPQPTLRDVPRLVEDARRAGERVELSLDVGDADTAPESIGRDAYRIVQEALTNVRKHAHGTLATVHVTGGRGEGLDVEVRNRLPIGVAAGASMPASGFGLVGLAERVELAGGTLSHGTEGPSGDFVVRAHLAWPA